VTIEAPGDRRRSKAIEGDRRRSKAIEQKPRNPEISRRSERRQVGESESPGVILPGKIAESAPIEAARSKGIEGDRRGSKRLPSQKRLRCQVVEFTESAKNRRNRLKFLALTCSFETIDRTVARKRHENWPYFWGSKRLPGIEAKKTPALGRGKFQGISFD